MDDSLDDVVAPAYSPFTSEDEDPEVIPAKTYTNPRAKFREWQENEKLKLTVETYLPLGCLQVSVDSRSAINTEEWSEAMDWLPNTNCPSLSSALSMLWRSLWVKIFRCSTPAEGIESWRLYILPDDEARSVISRTSTPLRKSLDEVLLAIDVSPEVWNKQLAPLNPSGFERWPAADFTSLFYLFNTLPSPNPSWQAVGNRYSRAAMRTLVSSDENVPGLLARLHPYQKRSAAEMLQREESPMLQLDPRLEKRVAPTGEEYFYNARNRLFLRHPRSYDSVRGGILAETMGLGKTVICLALVLATKGHTPEVPPQNLACKPIRPSVASLRDIAAATIARNPVPWRRLFEDVERKEGFAMDACVRAMEEQRAKYEIPPVTIRAHRYSTFSSPSEYVRLCSGTIIVVPKNLVHQWKAELAKHIKDGALKVLIMEDRHKPIPSPKELARYDIVLFSRTRFELENKNADDFYESPLKKLHWLRIIIDEGHGISSTSSNAAIVAERIVRAERRWVVSGTPAKDLMGIEVDLNAMTHAADTSFRQKSLEQRKNFNMYQEESSGAIKALGQLASRFLKAKPWASPDNPHIIGDVARWEDYIYRHESLTQKTYTGFSKCLRKTLESLVVKTRPEDVDRDIELPPLTHEIVRLQPSFFDKVTANLFVLLILSNAVTSERQDMDYLFHRNSQHHLHRLILSLRQSGFYWTSIDQSSVEKSLDVTFRYLAKEGVDCSIEDRRLVEEIAAAAHSATENPVWRAITQSAEMGMSIADWPHDFVNAWAFTDAVDPMVMGLKHVNGAQRYLNKRLTTEEPTEGFGSIAVEIKAALAAQNALDKQEKVVVPKVVEKVTSQAQPVMSTKMVADASGSSAPTPGTPKKSSNKRKSISAATETSPSSSKKRKTGAEAPAVELPPDSNLGRAKITGTTSAKLSYLLSRILILHTTEKILIFYDADFIAYYLAEALDLFHIKYIIYSSGMSNDRRGKHLVLFNDDPTQRVMLMDIKQAAHGLNVSSASRVFFVNPVCRPNIEAQAIKRAHRIGQTKPVHVETLVLKGTVEEAMHERACRMTSHEHLQAKTLEDDLGVARIIQSARILPISEEELKPENQMAKLEVPQQIFGRPGRGGPVESKLEQEVFGTDAEGGEGQVLVKKKWRAGGSSTVTPKEKGLKKETKAKGKKKVKIKEEPVDEPIAWEPARDGDWGPPTDTGASEPSEPHNSIFGGP